ncbi:MAG TPA: TIGR01777 family oxidoreductase [Gammaproteobacteria bacterium]|nr:TIGR01777 family oxidoreductase [Gammaproteobacteria bacterium]
MSIIDNRAAGKHVLVTGATGFIGRNLVYRLIERGDRVTVLARDREKALDLFGPHATIVTSLDDVAGSTAIDAIVNLAGAPIAARRWTRRRKRELLMSRIAVTRALVGLVARLSKPPPTWVNASAIGFYGVRADDVPLHEKSASQSAFQSELCHAWERCAARASAHGVKVALLRFGLVLGEDGGVLPALARPVRLGVRAVLGGGTQWVSWIHLHDLLELILFVLDQEKLAGPINATAPTPVRQAELVDAIAAATRARTLRIAIPARWLRALLGELAELLVDGQRVVPERATALGFKFRYATIGAALDGLLARRTVSRELMRHAS